MRQFKLTFILTATLVMITLLFSHAWSKASPLFQATPTPGFGPIIGPGYMPPTVATPLPIDLRGPSCQVVIVQPQLSLYGTPDALSAPTGTTFYLDQLVVGEVRPDGWVSTDQGWLMLTSNEVENAALQKTRACAILEGRYPQTTTFGLHAVTATGSREILALAQRMLDNGTPLGLIKGLNGTEILLNQVKELSPQTTVIFRSVATALGEGDCPSQLETAPDLGELARQWLESLQGAWAGVHADYYELMNECGSTVGRQTEFAIEAMKVANEMEICLLLYSFPAGQPAVEDFMKIMPAVQFAAQNPCRPGMYHGIALHASSFEDGLALSEADPWMSLRHRELYNTLVAQYSDVEKIPFFLTEAGTGGGGGSLNTPPCDLIIRDVIQYTYLLEQDPYLRGFAEWSFGAGTQWFDLTPCLEGIGTALITYYNN